MDERLRQLSSFEQPSPFSQENLSAVWMRMAQTVFLSDRRLGVATNSISHYKDHLLIPLTSCFRELRKHSLGEQREFLVKVCGEEGANFPNGQKLGELLVELNNIPWFRPEVEPDMSFLQEQVELHFLALNSLSPHLIYLIKHNWAAASGVLVDGDTSVAEWDTQWATDGVVDKQVAGWRARDTAEAATAYDAAEIVDSRAVLKARDVAKWAALWVVAGDALMSQKGYLYGSPFKPLIKIYGKGCRPMGVVSRNRTLRELDIEDGQPRFVIFVPPIQSIQQAA